MKGKSIKKAPRNKPALKKPKAGPAEGRPQGIPAQEMPRGAPANRTPASQPAADERPKRYPGLQGARPTVGLLLSRLDERYQAAVVDGVINAAERWDVNLLCIAGREIRSTLGFERQGNILYDIVGPEKVDGLLFLGSTLCHFISPEEVTRFCEHYRPLPIVSIAQPVEGIPSVLVDNASGMRDAVRHLIEAHGYRRIAFIRGPQGSIEADLRYRAYCDALAEHGLPLDLDLVAPGDFSMNSGVEAVSLFLDQRRVDFEAIVAANDNMALGALEALQARGIRVPGQVALVGFDDMYVARAATPPLTTVRQPLYTLGWRATEMLLACLAGEEIPQQIVALPTELVVRRSCGCISQAVLEAAMEGPTGMRTPFKQAILSHRERIVSAVAQAIESSSEQAALEQAARLVDAFAADLTREAPGTFLPTLDELLHPAIIAGDGVTLWQNALSILRRQMVPLLSGKALSQAENLWQQARVLVGEAMQRVQFHQKLQTEQLLQRLNNINETLMMTAGVAGLANVMAQQLPRLGIKTGYLSLYDGPGTPPEWSRCVLAYDERGRIELEAGGRRFPTRHLVPKGLLPGERRYTMAVEALYFHERQLGVALFEMGPREGAVYETLRGQISSTLQETLLVQQLERRAFQLQTAAEVSRTATAILDPDQLIRQVVELARQRFDLYYAGLFLVDRTGEWTGEPNRWAVLRAGTGEAGKKMLAQGHKLEIGGASMIGWCIANKQARIALDVGEEAVRFDNPLLPETRSELALPLISRGEVIGALTIQSTQEAAFSPEDITVLQTMADQLANAIANARLYEALAREQHLMKALMDNVPDYIYFKDRASRFIRTTKSHARAFGLSDPAEVVGKTDFDFFSEEHARQAYEDEQRIIATGEPLLNVEERETWPDRPDTWASTSKMPLRDEKGNIIGTFGVSRDITDRKRAEIALERRAIQLQAAAEVAREAAAIRDVRELLERTVHLISERFGFYHAGVFLIDEQGEYAILRAASSEGGARMLARGHRLKVGETGIVGFVAATGEPRIALDVGEDAVFFDNPDLPNTRSEMALPLKVRGRVIGVLDVQAIEPAAFTEEDLTVLQTMADQLAIAIDNANLIARTESQLRELNLLYGEYSAAAWARLVGSGRAPGYVYDRIGVTPLTDTALPALDLALERGETVNLVEPEAGGAVLAVPLKLRGQVIGTLGLQATDGSREWSPQEIALVEAVSEQVALALENARLFTESQRTARSMETLYETSRAMSSSLEEESTLRAILEGVYRTLGCEHVLISTVDEETSTIGVRHGIWQGQFDVFPEWLEMARYPLDQPDILTDVYRTGRTEIIAGWDDRFNREIYEKYGHERFLRIFMPIRMRERILGVVEVGYDRQQKERVSDEEVHMLAAFMDQAAVALENARLFEEARQRARRERQIYEIASKIRRSPDISTILQTAVDELGHALRTDRAMVRLMVKPRAEQ